MDELLKKCYGGLFKVGDKVRIRRDIKDLAELNRVDIDRYTIIFPNKIQESEKSHYKISYGMVLMAGETGKITRVNNYGVGVDEFAYELAFTNPAFKFKEYDGFVWGIGCLEEFHDYKAYVEGNSGKKKAPRKNTEKITTETVEK